MTKILKITLISLLITIEAGCQSFTGNSPFSLPPSDNQLAASVNRDIMSDPLFANVRVNVESNQGNVRLSGYVKTIRQSDTAGDIASRTNGVKNVQNDLIVRK